MEPILMLTVRLGTTGLQVKKMAEREGGIPVFMQAQEYNGSMLRDDETLEQRRIPNGALLDLKHWRTSLSAMVLNHEGQRELSEEIGKKEQKIKDSHASVIARPLKGYRSPPRWLSFERPAEAGRTEEVCVRSCRNQKQKGPISAAMVESWLTEIALRCPRWSGKRHKRKGRSARRWCAHRTSRC